jgi:pyridoxamine 5'-phosphate oxidase
VSEDDQEPLAALLRLHAEATSAGDAAADTMALATATPDGRPSLRYVSFRGLSDGGGARGLRFFTNLDSRKASELAANPRAAGLFLWASLGVQARVEGTVAPLDDAACDGYFAARPRGHQLAAWASPQSRPLAHAALLEAYAACERRFAGAAVPRPPRWGGFSLVPRRIELQWRGENRLHRRLAYTAEETGWRCTPLGP